MLIPNGRQCPVILALLIVVVCCCRSIEAKIYDRCDLARELHYAHHLPLPQIATWVCIAQRESLFNTAAVSRFSKDSSADHGLFQISDHYWCSHGEYAAKSCNVRCMDLLDNDIANDVSCVKTIYEEHERLTGDGFNAWTTYETFCRNQDFKHVADCFANQPQPAKPNKGYALVTPNLILDPDHVNKKYESNPFLKHIYVQKSPQQTSSRYNALPNEAATNLHPVISNKFPTNPFLRPQVKTDLGRTTPATINGINVARYQDNPFLKQGNPFVKQENPFLKHGHPQKPQAPPTLYNDIHHRTVPVANSHKGKVYTRCSLAQELLTKHSFPMQDIATWVCIAEHQSSFNTAAVGRQNGDGSANYGLFQISDRYWCSGSAQGEQKACNIACHKLVDEDLTDDVSCVKTIHAEHERISGDGFNAWALYNSRCKNQNIEHIRQCFDVKDLKKVAVSSTPAWNDGKTGKIYQQCELAQELYYKQKLPMDQIATWVCIAQYESSFNTAAVGRLNKDGSADHGLFQISDLYWCSHDDYSDKACNMPCQRLLDSDLTDDVRCIKMIHEEHTRISGDGFNAWTVYGPHCKNQQFSQISQCFDEHVLQQHDHQPTLISEPKTKGKVYQKCELAKELYHKHQMPMEQIPTWVCIAQHESSYNTAAVGRLNTDGSADHGLFQISDLYWCSHDKYGGKACNIPCDKLLDSDISDDVRCIKIIHEEHNRISGDGFNAWTVYKPHCRNKGMDHVKQCFSEKELEGISTKGITPITDNSITSKTSVTTNKGKIYNKCELAKELYSKHQMPMEQIPTWVCIAQHESSYNTAAVGRLNTDGSADHGLFQISDLYWCSHDQHGGKACNIPCDRLLDSDISDDVRCIKIIHEEHTRISGDGFNAWTVYKPHCRNKGMEHVKQCFSEQELKDIPSKAITPVTPQTSVATKKGKIYNKCELAKELYSKHQMPMEQIPTWVCIAQHESSFNTAAVGRLNTDGSADHGLFQISDLYWCSHDQHGGKACNIPCDRLLDSDISDDVRCIKIIHEEHTRISGDGFNAWTVYKPHCRNKGMTHIKQCFSDQELETASTTTITSIATNTVQQPVVYNTKPTKGKIYKKCELAQELLMRHKMPMEQIPIWVCIAQHESSFNTAAVGRLNADGSADHGLFQISDLYWCSHDQHGGKACNIPCDRLLDSDISDDVRCIKIIHEEHTQLSGDGFNAWTVYKPHCRNRKMEDIHNCFSKNEIELYEKTKPSVEYSAQRKQPGDYSHNPFLNGAYTNVVQITTAAGEQDSIDKIPNYTNNPFLQYVKIQMIDPTPSPFETSFSANYKNNPFLNGTIKTSTSTYYSENQLTHPTSTSTSNYQANPFLNGTIKTNPVTPQFELVKSSMVEHKFENNPFLNGSIKTSTEHSENYVQQTTSKPNYNNNPFLSGAIKTSSTSVSSKPTEEPDYTQNPFLTGAIKISTSKPLLAQNKNPLLENTAQSKKTYLDSNNFRTQTTAATQMTTTTTNPKTTDTITTIKPKTTNTITTTRKATTITTSTPKPATTTKPITTTTTTSRPKPTTTSQPITITTITSRPQTTTTTSRPSTTTSWTTKSTKATTPPRSFTTKSWYNNYKESAITTTTAKKPTIKTVTTHKPRTTTAWTTTTKRPTATKSWNQYSPTTTRKPPTTTTLWSTTTRIPLKTIATTKSIKTTTIWNWNIANFKQRTTTTPATKKSSIATTRKSITTKTPAKTIPTTKLVQSASIWSWDSGKTKQTTTTKRPITTSPTAKRPTTTRLTTKQPLTTRPTTKKSSSTSWTTTRKPITTTIPTKTTSWYGQTTKPTKISTIWNRNSGQYYKPTSTVTSKRPNTQRPITTSWTTTTKRPTPTPWTTTTRRPAQSVKTTTLWSWNKADIKQSPPSTSRKPTTTKTWLQNYNADTALKSSHSQATTTTKRPLITTKRNWQQSQYTNTTTIARKSSTTKRPTTTSTNWNYKTTKQSQQTIWHWQQPTTTQKPNSVTSSNKTGKLLSTTTKKPGLYDWSTWFGQGDKTTTKTVTTKLAKQQITTTPLPQRGKITTFKPSTTKTTKTISSQSIPHHKTTIPELHAGKLQTSYDLKNDPFLHPFFDRVKQEIEYLRDNITSTTGTQQVLATKPQHFQDSSYYQDYKNSQSNATKRIVSYNYGPVNSGTLPTPTTKRPRHL